MAEAAIPKVMISYAWSSEPHKQWVLDLATRLREDGGVEVILDRWHLNKGHNKYVFMEKMVTDSAVIKVLMVCDAEFQEKANAKEGGVGDESLVISPHIYGKATQEKFIPLIRERDDDGKECVPAFIDGRMYIDFCNEEEFEDKYDELLRLIHGRPELTPPPIGAHHQSTYFRTKFG